MKVVRTASLAALLIAACQTPPVGFEAARTRLARGDLVGALVHLDRVPPTDPAFCEARSLATAVERRVRTSQRLFARGLSLRAQWRDTEAIASFELARDVWPQLAGIDALIEATRSRVSVLQGSAIESFDSLPGAEIATTQPVGPTGSGVSASDDLGETITTELVEPEPDAVDEASVVGSGDPASDEPSDSMPAAPIAEIAPPADVSEQIDARDATVGAASSPAPDEAWAARLARARRMLQSGAVDDALAELRAIHDAAPDSLPVRELWGRVLHQRALLHYGQGELAAAVETWRRLLEIDPNHLQAREFHAAARTELDATRRR